MAMQQLTHTCAGDALSTGIVEEDDVHPWDTSKATHWDTYGTAAAFAGLSPCMQLKRVSYEGIFIKPGKVL
jgi:hypothetical protein